MLINNVQQDLKVETDTIVLRRSNKDKYKVDLKIRLLTENNL